MKLCYLIIVALPSSFASLRRPLRIISIAEGRFIFCSRDQTCSDCTTRSNAPANQRTRNTFNCDHINTHDRHHCTTVYQLHCTRVHSIHHSGARSLTRHFDDTTPRPLLSRSDDVALHAYVVCRRYACVLTALLSSPLLSV